ncbi:autotransporter-associated beta strand repeat-containing protein [Variovorax sp. RHLX14]|uniref:autotransporter-associated beta strand repeat-containing protein n=1 Tax=Variovorax sp. RHLX14 TaxID=1259731 RepID=UPI003F462D7F
MTALALRHCAVAALLTALWASPAHDAHAATRTLRTDIGYPWINDGAAANWVEGVFPVAADNIVLNGSGQLGGFFSPTYNSIKFYDMAACYTGGTVTVTTNFTLHSGTTCGWGDQVHGLNVTGNISIGATIGAHLNGFAATAVGGNVTVGTAAPSTWTLSSGNATVGGVLNLGTSAASYGNLNLNNRTLSVPTLNGNGGTIFFQTTGQLTLTGGASTLGAATAVNGAGILNLSSAATNLTIDASAAYPFPIVISGPGRIVKTGAGALNLSAVNTYTGTTAVNGGTVSLSNWNVDSSAGAWGNSAGAIQMAGGGADYTGASASGMLRSVNLLSGSNTFNIVNAGTTLNFSGAHNRFQSTGGNLVKTGAGTLQLGDANISNSAIIGKVAVNAGTLEWWAGSSMPAPASLVPDFLTLNNGGTLGLSFPGANTVSANLGMKLSGTATIATAGSPTIPGVIGNGASAGGFAKTGTGMLTLSGYNTYTGLTTVNAGTLMMANASGTLRPNNNITVNSGGTLTTVPSTLSNFVYGTEATGTGNITLNSGGKATTGNGVAITLRGQNFILNGGELASGTPSTAWGSWILDEGSAVTVNTSSVISASNLNLRAANTNVMVASGQTLNVTGTLTTSSGSGTPSGPNGGLTKLGAGTMNLSGVNTYKGATTVTAGTLVVQNTTQTASFGIASGAVLEFNSSAGTNYSAMTFSGSGTLRKTGTGTVNWGIASATFAFDAGALIDVQAGTLIGGSNNNDVWTGNLASLTIASGAAFSTAEAAVRIDSLQGAGSLGVSHDTANFPVSGITVGVNNGDGVFSGVIASSPSATGITANSKSFTKVGTGTQTLSGANTYVGITAVSAGKLFFNGNQAAATGAINVASGATLGGSGTLGGAVTISSGGTLAPGNSPGVITMAGLSLPTGAILAMELGQAGVIGGTFNDRVQVNGNLTLGGGTVDITVPTTPAGTFTPGTYRLIDYTGTLTNTGGLVIGTVPAGPSAANMYIDVNTTAKQVNLVVRDATYVNWDVTPQNDGVVNGGTGVWNAGVAGGSTNWTSSAGGANSGWYSGGTAVFSATAGTVNIDNALGAVNIGGLTFNATGYTLSGGTINGSAASNVLTAGAGVTATVGSLITGGPFIKQGPGTILLSGANISYTAATSIAGGTLALKNDGIYYSSSPTSVASGATLKLIATGNQSNRDTPITLASGAILEHEGLLNWTVWGPAVTSTGATTINQTSTSTGASGRGFYPDGGLAGSGTVTVNGGSAGSGVNFRMSKSTFSGTIVVNGIASITPFSGSGIGVAGSETSLQNVDFTVNGTMELGITGIGWANNAASAFTLGALNGTGVVVSNSPTGGVTKMLTVGNTNTAGSFSGVVANGTGTVTSLVKTGSAAQTLSGLNTYGGTTTASGGTLKLGISGALPSTTAVTIAPGATLDLQGMTQSVKSVASTGTVAFGTSGRLTLTTGASSVGVITGTGTITINTGATLTLTSALANADINIVLNGGTLNLGTFTHSIGTVTVNANSTLDFSSTGNAQLTTTSLTLSASNTLAGTNWTQSGDRFYAGAFVGAARNTIGIAPMNRITLGGNAAAATVWQTDNEITLQLDPKLRISKTSNGGIGSFVFQLTGLSTANDSIATVASGVAVQGSGTVFGTSGVAATIAESGVPSGWPANPLSASCTDANGASNANGTATFGTLAGNTLSIAAARMLQGADIACSFVNTLNSISGIVFNDGGAPTAGVNTGVPNDGLQNGSEAGLAGVSVGLTDCASVTHAVAVTDSAGRYVLNAPAAAAGQTVCVRPTLVAGQRATGANVEGTIAPDAATTTVGGSAFVYGRVTSRLSFIEPASGTRTLNFGLVPESTLAANSSRSAAPGATAMHAHTFVAGTGGSVSFASGASTATPEIAGWNEVMYLNPGCATSVPPGATKLSPPSVAQSVVQGQTVCFFVQAFVPAGAVNGSSNSVPVIATLNFTNAAPLLTATYTVTDVTMSGTSALSLQKEVRNITTGGAWGTSNQAKSGDTLEYRITYANPSAVPLTTVVIIDGTNHYTTFVSASASTISPALGSCTLNTPNNPAPAAGVPCMPSHADSGKGTVRWEFSGTLAPGATGTVNYSVLVD